MTASLKIKSQNAVLSYTKTNLKAALNDIGRDEASRVRSILQGGGVGKTYGEHTASAPGQAPAQLTGQLSAGVKSTVHNTSAIISDSTPYASYLEFGAKGGRQAARDRRNKKRPNKTRDLQPRPFMAVQIKSDISRIQQKLESSVLPDIEFKVTS